MQGLISHFESAMSKSALNLSRVAAMSSVELPGWLSCLLAGDAPQISWWLHFSVGLGDGIAD